MNGDEDHRERLFIRLYDEHVEAVRRYAWRRDPALADDVVAETFLVAWRRLGANGPPPRATIQKLVRRARPARRQRSAPGCRPGTDRY